MLPRSIKNWFKQPPEFQKRLIRPTDREIFRKAVKLYFFLHHINHDKLPEDWADRFGHYSNVIYSMIRGYMLNGQFELEYLDFMNEQLAELQQYAGAFSWQIPPDRIDEIELKTEVPLTFSDEETGNRLEVIYYPESHFCKYRFY